MFGSYENTRNKPTCTESVSLRSVEVGHRTEEDDEEEEEDYCYNDAKKWNKMLKTKQQQNKTSKQTNKKQNKKTVSACGLALQYWIAAMECLVLLNPAKRH